MSEGVSRLPRGLAGGEARPAGAAERVSIVRAPPSLQGSALPQHLNGTITGSDGRGHILVKTDFGEIVIASRTPIAAGETVHLEVFSTGARLHALILTRGAAQAASSPSIARPVELQFAAPLPAGGTPRILEATLAGSDALGRTRLATELGDLLVATRLPLPAGSKVLLHITVAANRMHAVITDTGGRALIESTPGSQTLPVKGAEAPATSPLVAHQAATLGRPVTVHGLTLRGLAVHGIAPPEADLAPTIDPSIRRLPLAPEGLVRILAVAAPIGGGAPSSERTLPGLAPATRAVTTALQQIPAMAKAALTPAASANAEGAPSPPRLGGWVAGPAGPGGTLVRTAAGSIVLDIDPPPRGTYLVLEVVSLENRPGVRMPSIHGGAWPNIETVSRSLLSSPESAAQLSAHVPQPGPRLASSLLFLMSALGAGDLGRWFGPDSAAVRETVTPALFDALSQEVATIARSGGPVAGDWRLFFLPIAMHAQVLPVRLYLPQRESSAGREGDEDTSFAVEVDLSETGPLRIDALVRARRLDLVLRTRDEMPSPMRGDIQSIFADALYELKWEGELAFRRFSQECSFEPEPPLPAPGDGLIV